MPDGSSIWNLSLFEKITFGIIAFLVGAVCYLIIMINGIQNQNKQEIDALQSRQIESNTVEYKVLNNSQQKLITSTESLVTIVADLRATINAVQAEQQKRTPAIQSIQKIESLLERLTDRQIQLQIEMATIKNQLPKPKYESQSIP